MNHMIKKPVTIHCPPPPHFSTFLSLTLALLLALPAAAETPVPSPDPTSAYTPTAIINGDFATFPWMDFTYGGVRYTDGFFQSVNNVTVHPNGVDGGWNTTETSVWNATGSLYDNFYDADPSTGSGYPKRSDGKRTLGYVNTRSSSDNCGSASLYGKGQNIFIEMNASHADTLYQDLTTHGNDVIRWTLKHAARTSADADTYQPITVLIGAPQVNGSSIVYPSGTDAKIVASTLGSYNYEGCSGTCAYANVSELASLRLNKSTQSGAWYTASGVYMIPEGQSVTRFAFRSDAANPSAGNFLDDLTFSTLIGNLGAKANADGSVTVTGYWGDADAAKKLCVKIGANVLQLDMSGVLNKNFTVTIPAETIADAAQIEVYHQDYEQAKRTVKIQHPAMYRVLVEDGALKAYCTNTAHTVAGGCDHAGEANAIAVSVSAKNAPYTGAPYTRAKLTGEVAKWAAAGLDLALVYVGRGETSYGPSVTAPTEAGSYTAKAVSGSSTTSVDFDIMRIAIGEGEQIGDLIKLPVTIDGSMTSYTVAMSGAKLELTAISNQTDWVFVGGELGHQYDSISLNVNAGAATASRTVANIAEEALATLRYTRAVSTVTYTGSAPGTSLDPEVVTDTAKMVPVTFASVSEGTTRGGAAFSSTNTVRKVGSAGAIPVLAKDDCTFLGWTTKSGGSSVVEKTSAEIAAIDPAIGAAGETWYAVWSDALTLGEFAPLTQLFPEAVGTTGNKYPQITIMLTREKVRVDETVTLPTVSGYTKNTKLSTGYSFVIDLTTPQTVAEIATNYLAKIQFQHVVDQEVRVVIGPSANCKTFFNIDTEHYYQYVPFATAKTWKQSYKDASEMSYAGRRGYLATITSKNEDAFIYKASSEVGWLGGTRLAPGTKVGQYYNDFNTSGSAGHWYWACGPECGKEFFDAITESATTYAGNVAKGYYFNWNSGEPNNSDGIENCLTTLLIGSGYSTGSMIANYSWNDIAWNRNDTTQWMPHGFFVEFGDKDIGDTTDDDPTIASASGYVIATADIKAPYVEFNAWGGCFGDDKTWEVASNVCVDGVYTLWNTNLVPVVRAGYDFGGWFASWTNGAPEAVEGAEMFVQGPHMVYAQWISKATPAGEGEKTFDCETTPDGGAILKGATNKLETTDLAIPEFTDNGTGGGAPVTILQKDAFAYENYDKKRERELLNSGVPEEDSTMNDLTSVTVSTYVTNIQSYAFYNCAQLTNVTFSKTRDYKTGEKATLYVRDWAFEGSGVKSVTFPADSKVVLDYGCFAEAEDLRDITFLGDVELKARYPFVGSGTRIFNADGSRAKVTLHLSAKLASDPAFVASLTNGMSNVRVDLSQDIEGGDRTGSVVIKSGPTVSGANVTFTFTVSADSNWLKVTEDTVYLFWSTTLTGAKTFIGNAPLKPTTLSGPDANGVYTATFVKPATPESTAAYFQLCIGEERAPQAGVCPQPMPE